MRDLFQRLHQWLTGRGRPPTPDEYLSVESNWTFFSSTNVEACAYFYDVSNASSGRARGTLAVRYLRKTGPSKEYRYEVPLSTLLELLAAPSKGSWIWDNFRRPTNYPFTTR